MQASMKNRTIHALLAVTLGLCALGAQAAAGVSIVPRQESLVQTGMSQQDVRQALGRPARHEKFMNEQGPTWTYDVATTATDGQTLFDVDFGADGKVLTASERVVQNDD